MPTARIRFRPSLVPTLATLLLFPALVELGLWQLHRAQAQIEVRHELNVRNRTNPIKLGAQLQSPDKLRYFRVVAKGVWDTRYQILLDNQVKNNSVGYDVITPLRIAGSDTRVLVDRGWVPMGVDREHLPKISTPTGMQEINGIATIPSAHFFTLARPAPLNGPWQKVWENMDMVHFKKAVPFPLQPAVIQLDPASPAGGFVRDWNPPDNRVAMHKSYAFQWFALATALVIIYIWVNIRKEDADSKDNGQEAE